MMYNKIVADCFFHPHHVGTLDTAEPGTVFFSNRAFSQGAVIDLYLHCDASHTVSAMRFKTNGNPYVVALLECLSRQSVGEKLEHLCFKQEDLIKLLELPLKQVPVVMQVEEVYKEILSLMNKKFEGES